MVGKKNELNGANIKYQLDTSLEEIQVSEELFQKTLLKIKNSEENGPVKDAGVKDLNRGNKGRNTKGIGKFDLKTKLYVTGSMVAAALLFIVVVPLFGGSKMTTDNKNNDLTAATGIEAEIMNVEEKETLWDSGNDVNLVTEIFEESVTEQNASLESTLERDDVIGDESMEIVTEEFKITHRVPNLEVLGEEQEFRTILEDNYEAISIVQIGEKEKKFVEGLEIQRQLKEILLVLQNSQWKEGNDQVKSSIFEIEFSKEKDTFKLELGEHITMYINGVMTYNYSLLYPKEVEGLIRNILE